MFEFIVVVCLFYICWTVGGKTDKHDHGSRQRPEDRKASDPFRRR